MTPRIYPLGFPSTVIPAGDKRTLRATARIAFSPRQLILPSDYAGAVVLEDVVFESKGSGRPRGQLGSDHPIAGRIFSELAQTVFCLDDVHMGDEIALTFSNASGCSVTCHPTLLGPTLS